ncbi:MAG TPA: hypothetical protein V6C72_11235 [Chroococcales cyanobacterium]
MGSQFSHVENEEKFMHPGGSTPYDPGPDFFNEAYSGNYLLGAYKQEKQFESTRKYLTPAESGMLTIDPIELGGPARPNDPSPMPVKFDGSGEHKSWTNQSGDGSAGWSGQKPGQDAQALQQTFSQMNSSQLSSMIFSLPAGERDAIIGALPEKDREKYMQGFATEDMVDMKGAQENALSKIPKEDLAKAMSEVLSDPEKYKETMQPVNLHAFKPVLME